MIQQASLSQLNDIVPPADASWWPPTWWSLGSVLLFIAIVAFISYWLVQRRLKARARREAYKQLKILAPATTEQVTLLLKQVALAYYPQQRVSNLHGQQWLTFLLSGMSEKSQQHFNAELQQYDINRELYGQASNAFCELYKAVGCQWLQLDLSKMPGEHNV